MFRKFSVTWCLKNSLRRGEFIEKKGKLKEKFRQIESHDFANVSPANRPFDNT